jgi:hypothetical protein
MKRILSVWGSFLGIILMMMFVSCSTDSKGTSSLAKSGNTADENVEIISNTAKGLWGEDKTIRLDEELIIGKEYGDDTEIFGYIRGVAIDGEDNIFVADSYELTIKVFDDQGNFLERFGREGAGPAEFQTIDDIHWCRFDDLLYVVDRRNNRIAQFSPDGKFNKAFKTTKFKIRVMKIDSYEDGTFALSGMRFGGDFADYRIILVDHAFENVIAECGEDFPVHSVGMDMFPDFSDVRILSGVQLYYTSPSEYKIVLLDNNLNKIKIIEKSHPRMFPPQYVRGFYADFNGIENISRVNGNYVAGVSYTNSEEIPQFQQKMDFANFVDNEKEAGYQLDLFDIGFRFLASTKIPSERRLSGADSKGRLYFIENEPFPRLIRCRLITE